MSRASEKVGAFAASFHTNDRDCQRFIVLNLVMQHNCSPKWNRQGCPKLFAGPFVPLPFRIKDES